MFLQLAAYLLRNTICKKLGQTGMQYLLKQENSAHHRFARNNLIWQSML